MLVVEGVLDEEERMKKGRYTKKVRERSLAGKRDKKRRASDEEKQAQKGELSNKQRRGVSEKQRELRELEKQRELPSGSSKQKNFKEV